jgi:hypothetical protein
MMTTIFTGLIAAFVSGLTGLLRIAKSVADFAIAQGVNPDLYHLGKYFTALGSYLGKVERMIPIVEMFTLLAAGAVVAASIRTVRWALAFIPTINAG